MSKIYLVHGFMYFVQRILTIYILTLVTFGSLVLSSFSSENRSLLSIAMPGTELNLHF